ncbi:MAG: hypothetical protein RRC34_11085 [Lentisphaeria bacterium]|nr:hypothetical protein [Lentisphaeria bacterium]
MMIWSNVRVATAIAAGAFVLSIATPLLVTSSAAEPAVPEAPPTEPGGDMEPRGVPGEKKPAVTVQENVDQKLHAEAMAVVRARTTQKPITYTNGQTTSIIVVAEVIEVLKQPDNWDDFDEIKRWRLMNQLRRYRGENEHPLVLRLLFQHDDGQKAPVEGVMTVYLDQGVKEEIAMGGSIGAKPVRIPVKTLKPHGDSIDTAISHVRAVGK